MGASRKPGYIPTLDGWRAIAILLVIGAHCCPALLRTGTAVGKGLAALFIHAGYGVDVFFAISGYLIGTLLLKEKSANGTISLGRFYTRRVFRILPPILVYLATIYTLHRFNVLPILYYIGNHRRPSLRQKLHSGRVVYRPFLVAGH